MSDMPPPGGQQGGGRQPTEEELRAYLGQMRSAPAGQIVAEVISALLNGAQVKLGRKDARLLLDLAGSVTEQAREHLDDDLTSQVDDALSQLRMGQVEAEREVSRSGQPEPNDLGAPATEQAQQAAPDEAPTGPSGPAQQQPEQEQAGSSAASRLWIPGR